MRQRAEGALATLALGLLARGAFLVTHKLYRAAQQSAYSAGVLHGVNAKVIQAEKPSDDDDHDVHHRTGLYL